MFGADAHLEMAYEDLSHADDEANDYDFRYLDDDFDDDPDFEVMDDGFGNSFREDYFYGEDY